MSNTLGASVEWLESAWTRREARICRSALLVLTLLLGVALIELSNRVDLPWPLDSLPSVHTSAISWAIGLLLLFELVEMAFAMSKSVASSVARHLQLYALVLLRDAFLKLQEFPEPIRVNSENLGYVGVMASDAFAAVLLFIASIVFQRLHRRVPITSDPSASRRFKSLKGIVVGGLLATVAGLVVYRLISFVVEVPTAPLLESYFTVLVFADVLLAFMSLAFADHPAIVFRNFGFAFAAILLRLAVTAPEYIRPMLGIGGAVTAIVITLAYRSAVRSETASENEDAKKDTAGPGVDPGSGP
ncbi:MAG: hypothetical protein AAF108_11435 [Planctomycetota bacterium]